MQHFRRTVMITWYIRSSWLMLSQSTTTKRSQAYKWWQHGGKNIGTCVIKLKLVFESSTFITKRNTIKIFILEIYVRNCCLRALTNSPNFFFCRIPMHTVSLKKTKKIIFFLFWTKMISRFRSKLTHPKKNFKMKDGAQAL